MDSAAPVAPSTPQERIETLFVCSGLSPLCEVLARLTLDSHTGRVLTQISRSFSELARVGQNAASYEVEVLETEGDRSPPSATRARSCAPPMPR